MQKKKVSTCLKENKNPVILQQGLRRFGGTRPVDCSRCPVGKIFIHTLLQCYLTLYRLRTFYFECLKFVANKKKLGYSAPLEILGRKKKFSISVVKKKLKKTTSKEHGPVSTGVHFGINLRGAGKIDFMLSQGGHNFHT